jgi:hypothetical protein
LSVSSTAGNHPNQVLLASADNGMSFANEQSPCTNGLGGQLAATSSSVVWAVCPTGMLAGALRSTDGGVSWSSLDAGRELSNSAQIAPASDTSAVLAPGVHQYSRLAGSADSRRDSLALSRLKPGDQAEGRSTKQAPSRWWWL